MNNKNYMIDIERLRGFACILVFIQHLAWACQYDYIFALLPQCMLVGSGGVSIFFAISGFVVTLSLMREFEKIDKENFLDRILASKEMLCAFFRRRFFRIFPVLAFTFITIGIFLACVSDKEWAQEFFNVPYEVLFGTYNYMMQLFVFKDVVHYAGTGPWWTLAVEAQFYLIWPIVLLLFRNNSQRAIFTFIMAVLFMFVLQPMCIALVERKYYYSINYIHELLFGAFFAFMYTGSTAITKELKIAAIVLLCGIWIYPSSSHADFLGQTVVSGISILLLILTSFKTGLFDIPVIGKVLEYLGSRSCSFYVSQLTVAYIVKWYTNSIHFPKESFAPYEFMIYQFVILIITCMIVFELLYRFIEKPFREYGRR